MNKLTKSFVLFIALVALGACSTQTVKTTTVTPLANDTTTIAENELLDIGIGVFEPGLDDIAPNREELTFADVRLAETQFVSYMLAQTLQSSGDWGVVRVVPGDLSYYDLAVNGMILQSDGEKMILQVNVTDATGKVWLNKEYEEVVSQYSYDPRVARNQDSFQGLYNRIANDILAFRQQNMHSEELVNIRTIGRIKFASSFAPQVFDQYLATDNRGITTIERLPAANDPLLARVDNIRERDYLFVDALQDHYGNYYRMMTGPYTEFRKMSYEEVMKYDKLRAAARRNTILGVAAIIGGLAATQSSSSAVQYSSLGGLFGGGYLIKDAFSKRDEAQMQVESLAELGNSLEAEIAPHTIELEERVVTLSGTVDAQYSQWREILADMYANETGAQTGVDGTQYRYWFFWHYFPWLYFPMIDVTSDKPSAPADSGAAGQAAPALGMGEQAHLRRAQTKTNGLLWGIFVLLLVLVGGVIFILPNYVAPADPDVNTVAVTAAAAAAASQAPAETPFEEAQRARQREEAQNTLAALLELQDSLEEKQVALWAEAPFTEAIALARQGDDAYATQDFTGANGLYQSGLAKLQEIEAGQSAIYTDLMAQALAAYQAGAAAAAEKAYDQALLLQPDSMDAATGRERAGVLTQVLDLLDEGRDLQADNLEAAREKYQQALALDPSHAGASAAITEVNRAIVERNFAAAMSRGYAALQNDRPSEAQEAFRQALAIKPGSAEVTDAIQQAKDQETFTAVSVHVEQAEQHEADENWAAAITAWDQALAVDPNLISAQEGRRRSDTRNTLDIYLRSIVDDPLRLADEGVQAQAAQVLVDARGLTGAKLQSQIQQISGFLERVRIPVTVQLQSDGVTTVTVYRVAELGVFTNQTLSLLPGAYTAVGVRPGYRDVRQEFVVSIDGQAPVVTVSCTEAI